MDEEDRLQHLSGDEAYQRPGGGRQAILRRVVSDVSKRIPGLGQLPLGVLASLIAAAIVLVIGSAAATVAITNNNQDSTDNKNTQTVGGQSSGGDSGPISTTGAGGEPTGPPQGARPTAPASTTLQGVRFDPSENGTTLIFGEMSEYFFDRELFIALGRAQQDSQGRYLEKLVVQEGSLPQCVFPMHVQADTTIARALKSMR